MERENAVEDKSLRAYLIILVVLVGAMFYLSSCAPLGLPPEAGL